MCWSGFCSSFCSDLLVKFMLHESSLCCTVIANGKRNNESNDAKNNNDNCWFRPLPASLPTSLPSPLLPLFQIAARLQEFVAQNMEKELVFSSELSSGERSAAHSLAGAEGLGHESLGEDSNRTIRVWKVTHIGQMTI